MNKTLFLVFGPESSGNHVTSHILMNMGCYWEEPQKLDKFISDEEKIENITDNPNIVLRRSVPHGKEWSMPSIIRKKFNEVGYNLKTVIPVRDWTANCISNYYHREESVEDATIKLQKAWEHIGRNLVNVYPFFLFNTSLLFKDPVSAIKGLELFTKLRFNWKNINTIYDADIGKHHLLDEHGFTNVDRVKMKKYINKPKPVYLDFQLRSKNHVGIEINPNSMREYLLPWERNQ